jgi:pyridoxine 5-phosphate synthase
VALLVEPDMDQLKGVYKLGAEWVHLFTGKLGEPGDRAQRAREEERVVGAARAAARMGLKIMAGGGLGYRTAAWLAGVDEIEEIQVGHAFVARSCLVGVERAVRELREAVSGR